MHVPVRKLQIIPAFAVRTAMAAAQPVRHGGGCICRISAKIFAFFVDNSSMIGPDGGDSSNRGKNSNVMTRSSLHNVTWGFEAAGGVLLESTGMVACSASAACGTPRQWCLKAKEATESLPAEGDMVRGGGCLRTYVAVLQLADTLSA